jgi:predicted PolB exonuclease-like 3'-5' exonuclease
MADAPKIEYLVFDVESVADGQLVADVQFPGEGLAPSDAIARFQAELREKQNGRDFIPHTFQVPTAVVVGKVDEAFNLVDLVSLDEPGFRPHVMTEHFWRGWEMYQRPTWVTFNGRSFDLPLMELAAFRYGLNLQDWFYAKGASYKHPRNRYNSESHFDLHEWLTNYGATWFRGGLDLAATILGKPGKMGVKGYQVQEMWEAGKTQAISDYCRCDVLDTYFVFLRSAVLTGSITLQRENELVEQTHRWLQERAAHCQAYQDYLEGWGDWQDPFHPVAPATSVEPSATDAAPAGGDAAPAGADAETGAASIKPRETSEGEAGPVESETSASSAPPS